MIKNEKGFLSLFGLILALVITFYLVYLALNAYMSQSYLGRGNKSNKDINSQFREDKTKNDVDDLFLEHGIDRSSPKATIDSTVNKFKDIEKERFKQLQEAEKGFKQ